MQIFVILSKNSQKKRSKYINMTYLYRNGGEDSILRLRLAYSVSAIKVEVIIK